MTTEAQTVLTNIDINIKPRDQFGKECLELWREFQRREITYKEFQVATSLKAVEVLDGYRYKSLPSAPSSLLELRKDKASNDWYKLPTEKKNKIEQKVMSYPEVSEYLKKHEKISNDNAGNVVYLEDVIKVLLDATLYSVADRVYEVYADYFPNTSKRMWYEKEKAKTLKDTKTEDDGQAGRSMESPDKAEGGIQERAIGKDGETSESPHPAQANA